MIVTIVATVVIAVAAVSVAAALIIELGVLKPNSCTSDDITISVTISITISVTGNDMLCICIRNPVH
jgi:hypothetical protein